MITLPKIRRCMPNGSVKPWLKKPSGWIEFPRKGKKVPELNVDAVRELGLYSYRILYEIKSNDLIEVLAVIHKRQHLELEDIPREQ